jgi:hypothetical protein
MVVVMMPLSPSSSSPCCRTSTAAARSASPIAAAAVGCDAAVCEVLWRAVAEGEAGDGCAAGAYGEGGLVAAVQQVPHLRRTTTYAHRVKNWFCQNEQCIKGNRLLERRTPRTTPHVCM